LDTGSRRTRRAAVLAISFLAAGTVVLIRAGRGRHTAAPRLNGSGRRPSNNTS
jgi:hypothetical protein